MISIPYGNDTQRRLHDEKRDLEVEFWKKHATHLQDLLDKLMEGVKREDYVDVYHRGETYRLAVREIK